MNLFLKKKRIFQKYIHFKISFYFSNIDEHHYGIEHYFYLNHQFLDSHLKYLISKYCN